MVVEGLDPGDVSVVEVRPTGAAGATRSMGGTVRDDGSELVFLPRFPFVDGVDYEVRVIAGGTAAQVATLHRPARAAGERTSDVVDVRPDVDTLPFNALKLYVRFSAPMAGGDAAEHIRLVDDLTGDRIPDAFFSPDLELWDPSRTRLTILFDPARIKRGLVPHEQSGYPLQAGRAVRLVVDAAMRDRAGIALRAPFERRYEVGADVRARVDCDRWSLTAPQAGTTGVLRLDFDRALDHAMLRHAFVVRDADGREVAGDHVAGDRDRSWRFAPVDAWADAPHRIEIDPALEDLAGNNLRRVFDRDLDDRADDPAPSDQVALSFRPLPSAP